MSQRCYWCSKPATALCDNPIAQGKRPMTSMFGETERTSCSAPMCDDCIAHTSRQPGARVIVCRRGRRGGDELGCEDMSRRDFCRACVELRPNHTMPGITMERWRELVKQHASGTLPRAITEKASE